MNAASGTADGATGEPVAAVWRVADLEAGDPVVVCPACWPAVAPYWRSRADATVRLLGARPAWARCGVCDPERVC